MRTMFIGGVLAIGLGLTGVASPPRLTALEKALADWRLGCAGCIGRLGWNEQGLATFVAGRLASLGFPTRLARSGDAWWVLVAATEAGAETWIPVLPGLPPADREGQFPRGAFLGRIPRTATGEVDPSYLAPAEVLPLPPNAPPSVRVRVHPVLPHPGESVWFISEATDPDGVVVQAWWEFGDGESSAWWSPDHVYSREGVYTVTLTVVDDRGAATTATVQVEVVAPLPTPPGGGCGCGR